MSKAELSEYLAARRKTIEASIAAEVLAGNEWKEKCERAALAELTALECELNRRAHPTHDGAGRAECPVKDALRGVPMRSEHQVKVGKVCATCPNRERGGVSDVELTRELSQKVHDGVAIAAALSGDMRDGESAVQWVKRVIAERERGGEGLLNPDNWFHYEGFGSWQYTGPVPESVLEAKAAPPAPAPAEKPTKGCHNCVYDGWKVNKGWPCNTCRIGPDLCCGDDNWQPAEAGEEGKNAEDL